MDGSDIKFLAPSAPQGSKFEITQGVVFIEGKSLGLRSFGGIRHLSLRSGWSFDLTSGIGGAEQVHLCGLSEDYRVSIKGNVLTLSHHRISQLHRVTDIPYSRYRPGHPV